MKQLLYTIFPLFLLFTLPAEAVYDNRIEKNLKKEYKEVVYIAHSDCYKVMSKSEKGYFGICDSEGNVIIPATYQKFAFEKSEDGDAIIFAMNPNHKAPSTGNLVYTKSRGKILDMGRSEPQYIPGDYITSYGKPIYNLDGRMVLDTETTSVQPIREGKEIRAYRVACRKLVNNHPIDELLVCDTKFRTLFSLDGIGYLWKVEIDRRQPNGHRWKCTKSIGANETLTLLFNADGSPVGNTESTHEDKNFIKYSNTSPNIENNATSRREYVVEKFEIDPMDLTARNNTTSRTDGNGRKCAVLKVYVDDQIAEAQGNVIGEIRCNGMENWIYLAHDSKQVKLVFDNHYPLLIKFIDYNFPTVSEQMTYVIRLK